MGSDKLALLVLAALIHALWNFISKQGLDKQVFLWMMMAATSVLFLIPVLVLHESFPAQGWIYIVLSGSITVLYVMLLGGAYQNGDLSAVYPLARGTAPVWTTLIAFVLLGETIPPIGLAGIALVAVGVFISQLRPRPKETAAPVAAAAEPGYKPRHDPRPRARLVDFLPSLRGKAFWLSISTGLTIAAYTVVDRVGVRYVPPVTYLYLVFLVTGVLLAPYMLRVRGRQVVEEWRVHKLQVAAVSAMSMTAYVMVLYVMRTTMVGYVSAVRESSVIFAALLGTLALRESFGGQKVLGAVVIFAGVVFIALVN
ncbi:MAG: DMT family transporter [Bacillota bacterium]